MNNVIPASRLIEKRRERHVFKEMEELQKDWDDKFCRELFALIRGDLFSVPYDPRSPSHELDKK